MGTKKWGLLLVSMLAPDFTYVMSKLWERRSFEDLSVSELSDNSKKSPCVNGGILVIEAQGSEKVSDHSFICRSGAGLDCARFSGGIRGAITAAGYVDKDGCSRCCERVFSAKTVA